MKHYHQSLLQWKEVFARPRIILTEYKKLGEDTAIAVSTVKKANVIAPLAFKRAAILSRVLDLSTTTTKRVFESDELDNTNGKVFQGNEDTRPLDQIFKSSSEDPIK